MSKKKDKRKNLQSRLTTIVEIYIEQKGKAKKKELKEFIEKKMDEIISFSESLSRRKKNKNIVPVNHSVTPVNNEENNFAESMTS